MNALAPLDSGAAVTVGPASDSARSESLELPHAGVPPRYGSESESGSTGTAESGQTDFFFQADAETAPSSYWPC